MQLPAITPRRISRPRRQRVLVPGVAFFAIAGFGYLGWANLPGSGRSAEMPLTAAATRSEIKITVSDRGELESVDAVTVTCELEGGGKLMSILAEGTRVAKGDTVGQIDPDQFQKLLNEQRVKLEAAEGKVKSCRSDLTQAESKAGTEIAKSKKTLTLAKIDLESYFAADGEYTKESEKLKGALELARKELVEAEEDLDFTKKQLRKGFGDFTAVKSKELSAQQKKFNVASAQAELTLLVNYTKKKKLAELEFNAEDAERELVRTRDAQESAIDKAKSELKAAESTAKIEKETLKRIENQIERCTIKAPAQGIIVYANNRWYDESSRIRPGAQLHNQQEIFSLPDLTRMKVKLKIHESAVKKVHVGMPATLQLEAFPNRILHGKVLKIATIAQADGWRGGGVKQYETEVSIDDLPTEAGLKPGMTADVKILVNTLPDALSVPVSAVTEYEGQRVVYVVRGKSLERKVIEAGEANEAFLHILGGLDEGETVALDARSRAAADAKSAKPTGAEKK